MPFWGVRIAHRGIIVEATERALIPGEFDFCTPRSRRWMTSENIMYIRMKYVLHQKKRPGLMKFRQKYILPMGIERSFPSPENH